jgi:Tol biopolymer transport system component
MKRTPALTALSALLAAAGLSLAPATPAHATFTAPVTGRASVLAGGVESSYRGEATDPAVSGDGRLIVFASASTLVPGDSDTVQDVYVKDLLTDDLERISVTPNGAPATGSSFSGAISDDGRYVAFWSWATNLVPGDTKGKADVFVRDRLTDTTERVSVTSTEAEANGASPSIINGDSLDLSDDGRYVTFTSSATNLGADANTLSDVFVRDRTAGTTTLVSVSSAEAVGGSDSYAPSMSANGRYVAFESDAANLVTPDTNSGRDVYVRDLTAGTTIRASLADNDTQPTGQSFNGWISDNGLRVAFASTAKMATGDANASSDVYVRTLASASTTLVSKVNGSSTAAGDSRLPRINDSGTVAFVSSSTAIAGGANGFDQVYVTEGSSLLRVSASTAGTIGGSDSTSPAIDDAGVTIAYESKAANLVPGDTGLRDVFFRHRVRQGLGTSLDDLAAKVSAAYGYRTPAQVAAAFRTGVSVEHLILEAANAPAFAGKRPALIRLYFAYFRRLPDAGGLAYWTGKLDAGTSLDRVSSSFAASPEFKSTYGATTNGGFVKLIYQNIFSRQPDAAGLAYWTGRLDDGTSRGTVMTNFSESSEGRRKLQVPVDLTLFPLGLYGKIPTASDAGLMRQAITDAGGAREGAVVWSIGI